MKGIKLGLVFLGSLFFLIGIGNYLRTGELKGENEKLKGQEERLIREGIKKENDNLYEGKIEEKLRQLFVVGLEGEVLNQEEKKMIKKGIGGIILFERNINNKEQLLILNKQIVEYGKKEEQIPFTGIDFEGGEVRRIKWLEEEKSQKEIEDNYEAFEIGLKRNQELKELGFNVNLAPVAEKVWEEKSFINRQDRAFLGENIERLKAYLQGCKKAKIQCVVKHFPGGLGRKIVDPHKEIPIIEIGKNELDQDLEIFREIMKEEIGAVMVSHMYYPRIDKVDLTSASSIFIKDVLRNELNFEGLVWIDEINMGAVKQKYDLKEFCFKAIISGADLIIVENRDQFDEIYNFLENEIRSNDDLKFRVEESFRRIMAWKSII